MKYSLSKFKCVAWASLYLFSISVHAHEDIPRSHTNEYFTETWTTRDGLPHNTINSIAQTEDGYIWLATWEGVSRYNGRSFQVFERNEETGFADAGIHALAVRDDGHLVVGGARGALHQYFQNKWSDLPQPEALVTSIEEDRHGVLWVATQGNGVYRVENQEIISFNQFSGPYATAFQVKDIPNLGIVAGTAEGLWVLSPSRMEVPDETTSWGTLHGTEALAELDIRDFTYTEDDRLLIGTEQGLYTWTRGSLSGPLAGTQGVTISKILVAENGALWLGSQDRGVFRVLDGEFRHYTIESGLPNNSIVSLFEDRENSIWVGTNGGLVRLRSAPFRSFESVDGLSDDFVRGLAESKDGRVYIATSRGMSCLYGDEVQPCFDAPELANESFLSVAEDANGGVWMGTVSNGVFHYYNGELTQYTQEQGLPDMDIRSIETTENQGVWFGTALGLVQIEDGVSHSFTEYEGLTDNFIMSVHEARDGTIWVGTGHGVTLLTRQVDGSYELSYLDFPDGSDAEYVFGIYEREASNEMWLTTDRGLVRVNLSDMSVSDVTKDDGLPFDKYFEVIEDQEQHLWLSSNRGIVRFPYEEASAVADGDSIVLTIEIFGESDGMSSAQANGGSGPSAIVERSGRLLFATSKGVASVYPSDIGVFDEIKPPVVIENVIVDGASVNWFEELVFSPSTQRIAFEFAGLGYIMPQRIQYRTKLVGFDDDWVERGTQVSSEYTNLAPGDYEFKVQANYPNSEQDWSETSVHFTLQPSIWEMRVFWAGLGAAVIVLMLLVYRWRLSELSRSEMQLKEQVKEKTQELERLAMEDILTGLPNRRALDRMLKTEFNRAQRYDRCLSLAILDVDHFKNINDQHSHEIGDKALVLLARVLRDFGREIDVVSRWGGEEFVILFPDTPIDDAIAVCERLRKTIQNTDCSEIAPQIKMTVSIGLAASNKADSGEKLLSLADAALYEAKQTGRNKVCFRK
ncbi:MULTISPECIES: ligand-binding sensor domain-containing diguanylate cyclase [Gammaproteobacteria]|uniref:ligand-binding sensor domain-containing diguanylate cyclase n=1 Tax=Gammaproteobacteria TaxID=1236 RepID=UPI000DD0DBEB|nr:MULTISPECIES: ligand-binding sensor domain-containing diguanylate cyclase [Gammaproteobacteria]RTE87055.1 GGDEF domain-containing protein [Aliidiomarina sp. B3213]TCZ93155.1 GGDEF domain-containing protein [Lysobacter sp. N42]